MGICGCYIAPNTRGLTRASHFDAGWSSPVARQAHNLKVVGSNPTPATNMRARMSPGQQPGLIRPCANVVPAARLRELRGARRRKRTARRRNAGTHLASPGKKSGRLPSNIGSAGMPSIYRTLELPALYYVEEARRRGANFARAGCNNGKGRRVSAVGIARLNY